MDNFHKLKLAVGDAAGAVFFHKLKLAVEDDKKHDIACKK